MTDKCANIPEAEIRLVLARLDVSSPAVYFSSGADGKSYSRAEMMTHVKACDEVGVDFIKMDMAFLQALISGELMKAITN
jgi:hypothetical protein